MRNKHDDLTQLGKTGIMIPHLGIGAWAWGDRYYWGFGNTNNESDAQAAFEKSLENGVNFFDTAEVYGFGASERLLGRYLHQTTQPVIIATKFLPYPWRMGKNSLVAALRASLERLGLEQVDLYQIHWPMPPISIETWAEDLAEMVEVGLVKAVGVSNFNTDQMVRAWDILAKQGTPLASNQVLYNLMSRNIETNGLLARCHELGITVIAYSPIYQGLLSGKYTPENPPYGIRSFRYGRSVIQSMQPLIEMLHSIGANHDGKTPAQVALNWIICKGAVPIPGAKNANQAQENTDALGWRLTAEEVAALDRISDSLAMRNH